MRSVYSAGLIVMVTIVATADARAQSLKLRQIEAQAEVELAQEVEYTNKVCESNLTVKFDWTAVPESELGKYSASGYCKNGPLGGIRRTCDDSAGKDAVKKKIRSVTCGFGPTRSIELKDGVINYKINFESSNDTDFVFEYLQNHL